MESVNGTYFGMCPEYKNALNSGQNMVVANPYKADVYSLGIVMI